MTAHLPMPDRVDVMTAAMSALLADGARAIGDEDAVGIARIRCVASGLVVGMPVLREVFGRMGGRVRPAVADGEMIDAGALVADVGGPIAAIRGAAPTALAFLTRLSWVAAGYAEAEAADPLDTWAETIGRLSPHAPVGDAGPSFELEVDP
jgi:Quinolinate phosphoribosyl transferase, N-terminal domain